MPSAKTSAEELEIIRAAKRGDIATSVRLLNGDGELLGARDRDGSTPLHLAVWKGHLELVQALLDAGADVNSRNQNTHWGTTPLHAAAHANRRAIAELLLARGADINARDLNGKTPLDHTAIHNARSVAQLLRARGGTE